MGALFLALLAASPEVAIEPDATPAWRAAALEVAAEEALAEVLAPDVVWRGSLSGDELQFTIVGPDSQPLKTGTIATRGVTMRALTVAITDSARGVTAVAPDAAAAGDAGSRGPPAGTLALFLLIAALIVASPLLAFAKPILSAPVRALRERRSVRWTLAIWIVFGAIAVIAPGAPEIDPWLIYGCGGIAWGVFVAANARIVFPIFSGFGRIEHRDVFRVLRAWAWVALLRGARRAFFYAPFFAALYLAAQTLELSSAFLYMVATPLWGLCAHFWFLALVENAAASLDAKLVLGPADEDNPWFRAIRGYYLGYVNRQGWDDGASLTRDVLFLPGEGEAIYTYGGGLTPSRIVIGRELLEFGLAPYGRPHDYEAPREDKLFWSDWHAGLIVPTSSDAPIAGLDARTMPHYAAPGDDEPPAKLGQPPTLAGFVEPSALDERLTHRPAEDPTWLEWDPGTDYDGTDAGDHDFLFGALVWQLGQIQRHDDQRETMTHFLAPLRKRAKGPIGRALSVIATPYRVLFARPQIELGDSFAAVNYARHHLSQLLAWQTWRDDAHLTSRALGPELERNADDIDAAMAADESKSRAPDSAHARLAHLASFAADAKLSAGSRWRRRVPLVLASGALIAFIALGVIRAINYHPKYIEEHGKAAEKTSSDERRNQP